MSAHDAVKRHPAFLVILILVLASALRIAGIRFGLPHLYHADEPIVVNHAMAFGTLDFHPHFFRIPPLTSYLAFLSFGGYFMLGKIFGLFETVQDFENLYYLDPTTFYITARCLLGIVPALLTVYLLYRLYRREGEDTKALLSALLLAVNFLHVRDSHYVYADMLLLLFLTASFISLRRLSEKPESLERHLLSGFLMGSAVGAKYNGGVIVFVYLLTWFWALRRKYSLPKLAAGLMGCIFSSVLIYFLMNPFSIFDWPFFLEEILSESGAHSGGASFTHHLLYSFRGAFGPFLSLLCLFSIIYSSVKLRGIKRFQLILFLLLYYLVLWKAGQSYDRYVLPLIPAACLFMGDAFVEWCRSDKSHKIIKILLFGVLTTGLVDSAWRSLQVDRILLAPDIRTQAMEWIERNIPSESKIALDGSFFMPRLQFSIPQLEEKKESLEKMGDRLRLRKINAYLTANSRPRYSLYFLSTQPDEKKFLMDGPKLPYDFARLKKEGVEYVITALLNPDRHSQPFFKMLAGQAELIQTWTPYRDPARLWPFDEQPLTGAPFLPPELANRSANGVALQLFRVKKE